MHPWQHHLPAVFFWDNSLGRQTGTIRPGAIDKQIGDDQDQESRKPDPFLTVE